MLATSWSPNTGFGLPGTASSWVIRSGNARRADESSATRQHIRRVTSAGKAHSLGSSRTMAANS